MAEKIIKTRILLKIDTYENWMKSSLILKKGEVAICEVPTGDTSGSSNYLPANLIKIGDGAHTFSELKWLQGVAADVPSWAKQAEPSIPAANITGLADYIAGEIQDTDTQYTIIKGDNDYTYKLMSRAKGAENFTTEVATLTIPDKTADINALKTLVGDTAVATQISNAIAALKLADNYEIKGSAEAVKVALLGDAATEYNTLGKLEDAVIAAQTSADEKTTMAAVEAKDYATKTEAQGYATAVVGVAADTADKDTVKGAKKYADNLNTAMDTRVDALEAAIGEGGSVADTIATEIGKLDVPEVAVGTGEIIEKISETDGKIAVSKRALVAGDIPDLAITQITGLQTTLDGKQDELGFEGDYDKTSNKVTTKSYVDSVIAGLNGAMHFKGAVTGATFEEAIAGKTYESGDVVLYGYEERVYDGTEWHILGNETIYQLKTDATSDKEALQAAIALKQDELGFDGVYNKETNKVATKKTVTDAITGLNVDEVAAKTGEIISSISETEGKVSVKTRELVAADIPELAVAKITGLQTKLDEIATKQDSLSFDGSYNSETNKVATQTTVSDAISSLKTAMANQDDVVANQFVTSAKQENGKVTVTRRAVTTDDIAQGTLTLIFDCGNSVE